MSALPDVAVLPRAAATGADPGPWAPLRFYQVAAICGASTVEQALLAATQPSVEPAAAAAA